MDIWSGLSYYNTSGDEEISEIYLGSGDLYPERRDWVTTANKTTAYLS